MGLLNRDPHKPKRETKHKHTHTNISGSANAQVRDPIIQGEEEEEEEKKGRRVGRCRLAARPHTKSRAPSSSCVDRAELGLPVSLELLEVGLARHQYT